MKSKVLHFTLMRLLVFAAIISCSRIAQAQIGVGTTTPHPSAMLHISAGAGNNKGLIVPKISSASRVVLDSTQNIAHGLVFFDTDLQKFYYFNQSPRQWFELDHDWIRKDVAGASPVIGTHIYLGVSGNVGIGTAANINPASKLTVVGNLAVGSAAYTQDSVVAGNGATFGTWVGVGTRTRTTGTIFNVKGNSRVQGNEVVTGQVTANRFVGEGVVPTGGIMMWSGTLSGNFAAGRGVVGTEYEGWALCDGRNGTPDLRGRFVVGLTNGDGSNYGYVNNEKNFHQYEDIGRFGGRDSVTLTIAQIPAHDHSATCSTNGSHSHCMGTRGFTTSGSNAADGSTDDCDAQTQSAGAHNHTITIGDTGGGESHENRPPYYVLAYIMKLP